MLYKTLLIKIKTKNTYIHRFFIFSVNFLLLKIIFGFSLKKNLDGHDNSKPYRPKIMQKNVFTINLKDFINRKNLY